MARIPATPFIFGKVATGDSFIDREAEKERIAANVRSRINTVLISPRRWGKSSLVAEVARSMASTDPAVRFCFIDLFNIRTEHEFYTAFTREVLRATYTAWEERIESAKKFFKRLTPRFTVGPDPMQDMSVSFTIEDVVSSPEEVLDLPEKIASEKGLNLVVCLDEFQNIAFLTDPLAVQKTFRSAWQHHTHATYCLYGSKRHMMMQLFHDSSLPFFKFGDLLLLEKIPESYWVPFIVEGFQRSGKSVTDDLAAKVARTMELHPYFVQQLAHELWLKTDQAATDALVDSAVEDLITRHTILFQREVDGLTNHQVNLLKALCDDVEHLSAADTLRRYNLGSSANVNRMKEALSEKEILDIVGSDIAFMDPLFRIWFKRIYMGRTRD